MTQDTTQGSARWNDAMYAKHPTPYTGLAGLVEGLRLRAIARALAGLDLPAGALVVEIGCERGVLLAYLAGRFPALRFRGIDISEAALADARARCAALPNVALAWGDLVAGIALPEPPAVLICSETLEHIPDVGSAVRHLQALCPAGGHLIATVPIEKWKNLVKRLLRRTGLMGLLFPGIEEGMSEWHVNDFSAAEFKGLFAAMRVRHYRQIAFLHQLLIAGPA